MKTQMNLLVAIILACSTLLSAGTASQMNLQIEKGVPAGTIVIKLDGLDQQNTRLSIQDISGKKWFSETVRKQLQYSKTVNLNSMPAGEYLLFVTNKRSQQSRAFSLNGQELVLFDISGETSTPAGLTLDAGGNSRSITRISAVNAHTLQVHLSNLQEYNSNIRLTAPNGAVKWEKAVSGQASFIKNIDLKALMIEPGTYVLAIEIGGATVLQELEISTSSIHPGMAHHTPDTLVKAEMAKK